MPLKSKNNARSGEMNDYASAVSYVQKQEATNISYVRVGIGAEKLLVCFASAEHYGFSYKTIALKGKYNINDWRLDSTVRRDYDVLFIRDINRYWYLGQLTGIGENLKDTVRFLDNIKKQYKHIICIGSSTGAYGGLLYGSLCGFHKIFASEIQTNLEFSLTNLHKSSKMAKKIQHTKNKYSKLYNEFYDISNILTPFPDYHLVQVSDTYIGSRWQDMILQQDPYGEKNDYAFHCEFHTNNLSENIKTNLYRCDPGMEGITFNNVQKFDNFNYWKAFDLATHPNMS